MAIGNKKSKTRPDYIYFTSSVVDTKKTDKEEYSEDLLGTGPTNKGAPTNDSESNNARKTIEIEEAPIDTEISQSEQSPIGVVASQESTRAQIALLYTYFFLMIVFLGIIGPFVVTAVAPNIVSDPLKTAKELVTVIASILGGSFGFIVGFYFKNDENS